MKRRWFTAMLGASPIAMSEVGNKVAEDQVTRNHGILTTVGAAPTPFELLQRKRRHNFNVARRAVETKFNDIRVYGHTQSFSHNIASLRSVSPQHKSRMQIEWSASMYKEERSTIEKLAKAFGIPWELSDFEDLGVGASQPTNHPPGY